MVQRLLDRGLAPSKTWAFAAGAADLLWTEAPGHANERVQWGYHVAPALFVRTPDGETREMVFDLLLFGRPVPVEEWRGALHDTPTLVRTAPGEPPLPARRDRILARPRPPRRARAACARRSKSTGEEALDGARREGIAPWSKH